VCLKLLKAQNTAITLHVCVQQKGHIDAGTVAAESGSYNIDFFRAVIDGLAGNIFTSVYTTTLQIGHDNTECRLNPTFAPQHVLTQTVLQRFTNLRELTLFTATCNFQLLAFLRQVHTYLHPACAFHFNHQRMALPVPPFTFSNRYIVRQAYDVSMESEEMRCSTEPRVQLAPS
jgi:hypothetical protein